MSLGTSTHFILLLFFVLFFFLLPFNFFLIRLFLLQFFLTFLLFYIIVFEFSHILIQTPHKRVAFLSQNAFHLNRNIVRFAFNQQSVFSSSKCGKKQLASRDFLSSTFFCCSSHQWNHSVFASVYVGCYSSFSGVHIFSHISHDWSLKMSKKYIIIFCLILMSI